LSTSDSWPKLEVDFRELSNSAGDLHANAFGPSWHLLGGPGDDHARKQLHDRFDSLARLAGVRAGVPNRSNARDGWLTLVREECPHSTLFKGRMIQSVCLASAEACQKIERREIELQRIADSNGPYGLRRDMYQPSGWLYDHNREPLREPDAELDYWEKHSGTAFKNV
jgi:hypothetical protein